MVNPLRVIALEDRIVYDGAVAHDVVVAAPSPVTGFVSQPTPISTDHTDLNVSPPNVLVVSDGVVRPDILQQAAKDHTHVVVYDSDKDNLSSLNAQILNVLKGEKAARIGFATEGSEGRLQLLSTLGITADTLKASPDNQTVQSIMSFLHGLSDEVLTNGAIDLFGSNIGAGNEGRVF